MSGPIKVTFGELASGQSSIATTSKSIQQQLDDLKSFLQPMVSTWEGEASTQYMAKQAQWDQAAADINQVLHQISVTLGNTNDNYQQTESSNAARWS